MNVTFFKLLDSLVECRPRKKTTWCHVPTPEITTAKKEWHVCPRIITVDHKLLSHRRRSRHTKQFHQQGNNDYYEFWKLNISSTKDPFETRIDHQRFVLVSNHFHRCDLIWIHLKRWLFQINKSFKAWILGVPNIYFWVCICPSLPNTLWF